MPRSDTLCQRLGRWLHRSAFTQGPEVCCNAHYVAESLERRRLLAANLHITSAMLVDGANRPISSIPTGQMVFVRAEWTTTDLPANQYVTRFYVDGVALDSGVLTGQAGTGNYYWYRGGWFASPGLHSVQVVVDGAGSIIESDETDNTLSFTFTPVAPSTLPAKFITPIRGQQEREWTITNYVDLDPRASVVDYTGGPYTYDGHDGIDIPIGDFSHMDASVSVLAGADGTVTEVADGNFDRQTAFGNNAANYVAITHGNGWKSVYYHLSTNTISVKIGDVVHAGDFIGLVGSAGYSTDAHLHFQLYHDDTTVETYLSPTSYWVSPLVYSGSTTPVVMDGGISNYAVSPDLKERPSETSVFPTSTNWDVTLWYWVDHLTPADQLQVKWYRPNGAVDTTSNYSPSSISRHPAHTWTLGKAAWSLFPGTWEVAVTINGTERTRKSFTVTSGAGQPDIKVYQGSTYIIDGRTTAIPFGSPAVGNLPGSFSFTIQNQGSAALTTSNLSLPPGFILTSAFPSSIAAGASSSFNLRLDVARAGAKFGQVSFSTNDADESIFNFNVAGTVTGAAPAGAPSITLPNAAVAFVPGGAPRSIDAAAILSDTDSSNFGGGQLIVEMAGFTAPEDLFAIRNQGNGAGMVGIKENSAVTLGGQVIGTFTGGAGTAPLVINLNSAATLAATQVLLRNITYSNSAAVPAVVRRYVRITLTDETGKISNQPVKTVIVDATTTWDGGGDGVNWSDALNWSNDRNPQPWDHVYLSIASHPTINIGNGTRKVHSLVSDEALTVGGSLTINAGRAVFGDRLLTINAHRPLAAGGDKLLTVKSLAFGASGKLDLADNAMIFDYTGDSPISAIQPNLNSGYALGAWNGTGIQSSIAAVTQNRALGIAEASDLFSTFPATFRGQTIDNSSILIRYTLLGDATLDQAVDITDLAKLAANWQQNNRRWGDGDFNFDGTIDAKDLGMLSVSWAQSLLPSPAAVPVSIVRATPQRTAIRSLVL